MEAPSLLKSEVEAPVDVSSSSTSADEKAFNNQHESSQGDNNDAVAAAGTLHRKNQSSGIPPEFSESDNFLNTSFSSSNILTAATPSSGAPSSVTPSRKEELLRQAQADRLAWIRKVSLPYGHQPASSAADRGNQQQHLFEEDLQQNLWNRDDRLNLLQSSHALQHLPTIPRVLIHLYGLDDGTTSIRDIAERIQSNLETLEMSKDDQSLATVSSSIMAHELAAKAAASVHDAQVVESYHSFWTKLSAPECATLVQSLRHFIRNLEAPQHRSAMTLERLARSLQTYIDSTLESLQSHHAAFADDDVRRVRRSLESFLFGHCSHLIESLLWDEQAKQEEAAWMDRISSLQFIESKHLEIDCLTALEKDESTLLAEEMQDILRGPIQVVQSIDCYFSPFEKLQRILGLYQSVNTALINVLNRDDTNNNKKKLPSADDVLPTLILTVLRAKPQRIIWNLRMIEAFSPPEYLRGEAGYAYTNLYGAIQFLQDISLNETQSSSLSISPEEFRQGLESCRQAAEDRISHALEAKINDKSATIWNDDRPPLSVQDVRQARLGGEAVTLEWAKHWQDQRLSSAATTGESKVDIAISPALKNTSDAIVPDVPRSYSFLTARPEDVRVADLPQLLAEYRMLVHTTELLLAERANEVNNARKKMIEQQKQILLAKAESVNVQLLLSRKQQQTNGPSATTSTTTKKSSNIAG